MARVTDQEMTVTEKTVCYNHRFQSGAAAGGWGHVILHMGLGEGTEAAPVLVRRQAE